MGPITPRTSISSLRDMDLLREFNKKYLGQSNYDPTAASLGKLFYDDYLLLSAVGNDIRANDAQPPGHHRRGYSSGRPSDERAQTTPSSKKQASKPLTCSYSKRGSSSPLTSLLCTGATRSSRTYFAHVYTYATTTFSGSTSTTSTGTSSSPRMPPPLQPECSLNHSVPWQQLHRHLS